jgi:tetratricopeptide (TPR) repeat protein
VSAAPERSLRLVLGALALLVTASVLTSAVASAAPVRDRREMRAREAYAAGRYQDALDLYVKLYAEKLHPNFLRNIGRCYQNLDEPEKAIKSFREYLRKARKIDREEREEIQGYIAEMEQLRDSQAAAARREDPPPPPPEKLAAPPAVDPTPARSSAIDLQASAPPPGPRRSPPIYRRWWFWTAVGAVVVGGVAIALAARGPAMPACEAGRQCL